MLFRGIAYCRRKLVDFSSPVRSMSTFTSRTNIVTGTNEWVFVDDETFDYQQELARSAFADMLHDHERNVQYEQAIKKTIETLAKSEKRIHVLDIGTGTGLLSMMAARALAETNGASRITACEVFQPMAKIAKKCIEKNGFADRIRVVDKRSTELQLDGDLQGDRINIIVAEVFDTELIGEGALRTFSEACQHLTVDQENLRTIPARATIYVQLVESPMLRDFHRLKDLSSEPTNRIKIPSDCRHLAGHSIFDLNVNEVQDSIRPLSQPIPVFHFNFKSLDDLKNFSQEKILENITCSDSGQIDAFIMWWNLDMDEDGEIQLGTTPAWCYADAETRAQVQWREHWIHGVYYPQQSKIVKSNDQVRSIRSSIMPISTFLFQVSLYCFHDEYSLYFDVGTPPFPSRSFAPALLSRSAMAGFNCDQRRRTYQQALDTSFANSPTARCLYIGDGLLLPLMILELYPQIELILLRSSNAHLTRTLEAILLNSSNELNYRLISSLTEDGFDAQSIDMVLSEPFFSKSLLPWDNLHFYYFLQQNRSSFRPDVQLLPRAARLRCIALEFDHLHKIRSPVGTCCQFDLTPFDAQIIEASMSVDATVEPQALFEYSSKRPALSAIIDLLQIDFRRDYHEQIASSELDIVVTTQGRCNGVAFWIDYGLGENIWLTTGIDDDKSAWVTYSKQGVHLLSKPIDVQPGMKLRIRTGFDFKQGLFLFDMVS